MARRNNGPMRHLHLKGNLYRFRRAIPAELQQHFGGTKFYVRSLGTGDVVDAKRRRDELERETNKLFAELRRGGMTPTTRDAARELGQFWARELAESRADPVRWTEKITGHVPAVEDADDAYDHVMAEAEKIERDHGEAAKAKFLGEAFGHVGVDRYKDDFLREVVLAPKTMRDRTGHLNRFIRWAESEGLRLSDIDRKTAGRYFTSNLAGGDRRTAAKHLANLRGYWTYLTVRGHVSKGDNPWDEQLLPDRRRRVERGERENDGESSPRRKCEHFSIHPRKTARRRLGGPRPRR